jgi:pyruvate,water dikinase
MLFRQNEPPGTYEWTRTLQMRYRGLRRLLATNSDMLDLMADLEADLRHFQPDQHQIRQPILKLLDGSLLLAENLNVLTRQKYRTLYEVHRQIDGAVRQYLRRSAPAPETQQLMIPLDEANTARLGEVGGKAAHLGELRLVMPEAVPSGFVISTAGYRLFLEENNLYGSIRTLLRAMSLITDRDLFRERLAAIRALFAANPVPRRIAEAIADGVMQFPLPWPTHWAVRSSAVGEDGRLSFAGQFDSKLHVPTNEMQNAYTEVIASRFSERAMLYRLIGGFTEVETPMAVLFLPMLQARVAGVLYTRDPRDPSAGRMLINSVRGLADDLVRGQAVADTFLVDRTRPGIILEQHLATRPVLLNRLDNKERQETTGPSDLSENPSLSSDEVKKLVETALHVEQYFGGPQDIEWLFTGDLKLMMVQARRLRLKEQGMHASREAEARQPLLEGEMTIFPGRAVGPAQVVQSLDELNESTEGVILVVKQATPELGAVLPYLAGVIVEQGNPGGHAATLIREFGIPALFGAENAGNRVRTGQILSLDANQRKVFEGVLWPEVRERVKARILRAHSGNPTGPLHDLLLALNLTDPLSLSFRARNCKSVHDIIRFTHEKAVAAMFDLGDEATGPGRRATWRVDTGIPLNLSLLDLGGTILPTTRDKRSAVKPSEIQSIPFQALWQGISHPGVSWAGRSQVSASGFMSVMSASMADRSAAVRRLGTPNYVIVAPEYLNFNARLAYHFTMVDALVSEVSENNYVNFRFRGGGAGAARRDLRARFLKEVLLRQNLNVDRRGDLVTAWLRRYPMQTSEEKLTMLGKLMACARQLDMLLENQASVDHYVDRFLNGDYQAFA